MRYGHFILSLFCAWVLWSYLEDVSTPNPTRPDFNIEDGFASYEVCDVAKKGKEATAQRFLDWAIARGESGQFIRSYRCFPDTTDPRAPKAGS